MLGKLMKHELKLTAARLLPMYLVFFIITILARVTISINTNPAIFTGDIQSTIMGLLLILLMFLYVITILALCIMTYFVILNRFYKNLLGDEGYLMFTLPVKTGQLILSKLFTAFFWIILLTPTAILSFLILFMGSGLLTEADLTSSMYTGDITLSAAQIGLIVAGTILAALLETIGTILSCYLSMTLGQRFWHEHRLFGSILFFFLVRAICSTVLNAVNMFVEEVIVNVVALASVDDVINYYALRLPGTILVNLLAAVILYFIIHYLLDKKLNLN